jgi:hypothetical protein
MSKVATAEKIETPPPSLDEVVAILLKDPDDRPAIMFGCVLDQVRRAITTAEQEGKAAQAAAYDPAVLDPTAIGRAHDAQFRVKRLTNAAEALAPHYQAAVRREEQERWSAAAAPIERKITDLAREMVTVYPAAVLQLVDLFKRIAAADSEAAGINHRAPTGVRQLLSVEASIGNGKKIIEKIRLPVITAKGVEDMWPPRSTWASDYAGSVHAGIVNAKPAPSEIERAEEARRHIAQGEANEREHQRLSAEAAARADANAAEQRRLAAGELSR